MRQMFAVICASALLIACDKDEAVDDDSSGGPPSGAPEAVVAAFPTSGYVPLTVAFDGSGSIGHDGDVVSYSWDLDGDGSADQDGETVAFVYADPGTYMASLEVVDDRGAIDETMVAIGVLPDEEVILLQEQFDTHPFSDGRWSVFLEDCAEPRDGTVEYPTDEDGCGGAGGYVTRESTYRCVVYSGPGFTTEGYHEVQLDFWARYDSGTVRVDVLGDGAWQTVSDIETSADWTQQTVLPGGTITGIRVLLRDGAVDCLTLSGVPICRPDQARACPGGAATFSVSAFPGDTYQWQKDGADLVDGGHIEGATGSMLVIGSADEQDAGTYQCRISTSNGTVLSNPGTLSVASAPTIAMHPQSVEVTAGDMGVLTVDALGVAPLVYRWQKNGVDLTDGAQITGASTSELVINAVGVADDGDYRVVVSDPCGDEATSADAHVYVRTWDSEVSLVPGATVHIDLEYTSNWIIEAEFLGCDTDGGFDRYLQEEGRLDLFNRGSDQLALRVANGQIWFESANVGSVSTDIGDTDHFGETLTSNIEHGDHSIRIEYMGDRSLARLFWDGNLIGDWNLWIESVPGSMGDVEVSHMDGGTLRWYQGTFVSLADY